MSFRLGRIWYHGRLEGIHGLVMYVIYFMTIVLSLTSGAHAGDSLASLNVGGRRSGGGHSHRGKKGGENCELHLGGSRIEILSFG
jgi:hypothetical protein